MRYFITIIILSFVFSACKKDKFTTEPQIKFKKFSSNFSRSTDGYAVQPRAIIEVTDDEGDFDTDSARVYLRNTFTNKIDSLNFPNLGAAAAKGFKAEIEVGLFVVLGGRDPNTTSPKPYLDTIAFEIYIQDKAKHKSNVVTASPFYYQTF